jgi:MSHA biogenesis protein MshL
MNRTLWKTSLALLALVGLSGCAAIHTGNSTNESIRHDMDEIAQESSKPSKPAKIEAVNNALLPPLAMVIPKVDSKPLEARFDLAVNDTPASQVYMAIASGTRYNMLVPPGVDGNISINLKDVTVLEALDAIRELYGYEYKIDGTRIYIQPIALQTRLFQINYLTATRTGSSLLSVESTTNSGSSGITGTIGTTGTTGTTGTIGTTGTTGTTGTSGTTGTGGGSSSSRVSTVSNPRANFWTELDASLKAIVGSANGRSVVINSMSGVIVVRAMPDEIKSVTAYLKASQISIERQVLLEAKIVEVQLNDSFQSGINWAALKTGPNSTLTAGVVPSGTVLPTSAALLPSTLGSTISTAAATTSNAATNAAGSLFGLAFNTNNFGALLNFMESQGDVHVLSSPRIATLNNQKAILKVGTDEYYITGLNTTAAVTSTTATTLGTMTPIYSPMFSGIALDVTPNISENNEVILHVHPSVSSITEVNKIAVIATSGGSNGSVPMASTSIEETDSIVRARDGQVVVIGGLMSKEAEDNQSGLPGLSKTIFGQTNKSSQKRELVILLKPTVIDSDNDWSEDIIHSRDRMNSMTNATFGATSSGARP